MTGSYFVCLFVFGSAIWAKRNPSLSGRTGSGHKSEYCIGPSTQTTGKELCQGCQGNRRLPAVTVPPAALDLLPCVQVRPAWLLAVTRNHHHRVSNRYSASRLHGVVSLGEALNPRFLPLGLAGVCVCGCKWLNTRGVMTVLGTTI